MNRTVSTLMQNNHLINLFAQNVIYFKMTYQTYISYKYIKPNLQNYSRLDESDLDLKPWTGQ